MLRLCSGSINAAASAGLIGWNGDRAPNTTKLNL